MPQGECHEKVLIYNVVFKSENGNGLCAIRGVVRRMDFPGASSVLNQIFVDSSNG